MFENFKIITLRSVYEAEKNGQLPEYLGSTVRGIIGHCIREFVCDRPQIKCFKCPPRANCPYVKFFSNTGGKAGAVNPFVIYVHTNVQEKYRLFELRGK